MTGFDWMLTAESKAELLKQKIAEKQKYIKENDEAVKKLEYQTSLIKEDIVNVIREEFPYNSAINIFTIPANKMLYGAWWWMSFKDNNDKDITEEQRQDYKDRFEYVMFYIKREILNDDPNFILTNILSYNYEEGYSFQFKYKSEEIEIYIPNFEYANSKNYDNYLNTPYHINYRESAYSWNYICYESNWKELGPKLIAWLKEKGIYEDVPSTKSKSKRKTSKSKQ